MRCVKLEEQINQQGQTPLHEAVMWSNYESIGALIMLSLSSRSAVVVVVISCLTFLLALHSGAAHEDARFRDQQARQQRLDRRARRRDPGLLRLPAAAGAGRRRPEHPGRGQSHGAAPLRLDPGLAVQPHARRARLRGRRRRALQGGVETACLLLKMACLLLKMACLLLKMACLLTCVAERYKLGYSDRADDGGT